MNQTLIGWQASNINPKQNIIGGKVYMLDDSLTIACQNQRFMAIYADMRASLKHMKYYAWKL